MSKGLVIVESPAKTKTLTRYLGKDYEVMASYGHVRDLLPKSGAVDPDRDFEMHYEVIEKNRKAVDAIAKTMKKADVIYLATDPDREGEAISWHLKEALDLDDKKTRRIVFREITKRAIENAIQNPRGIDLDLVNAQQARRILDRLVGFELSPILWKKIKTGLSAGRVQSVAVRLVVEREREIDKFQATSAFRVTAIFPLKDGMELNAELSKRFKTIEEARDFLNALINAEFSISDLQKKPGKKSPAPPFTTSTLQQEASRKLGFSVAQTMSLAQRLYESGLISYMRTDSVNLSQEAIQGATAEIRKDYGDDYVKVRHYKTKSSGAQEAHEAIRPTNFALTRADADRNGSRLYELIWKRAIASQMADAQLEKTTATIDISNRDETFTATGEVIKFDGFLSVYLESTDDEEGEEQKGMLPPLQVGESLHLGTVNARESFTRHPARYTEASLVKKLEEMGIGRPSTYAPTISTIQKRNYVLKESRDGKERKYHVLRLAKSKVDESIDTEITGTEKNKLFPTNIAMVVNDFLVDHFPNVTNYSFTAEVEKEFDEIAQGKKEWDRMIDDFYKEFHTKVESTENIERSDVPKSREIGIDPKTGKKIIARLGRFGPLVQLGDDDDEDKKFAGLRHGQFIENITLEEALDLFKMPREIGDFEEKPMQVGIGRYGPYVKHDNKFVSIPKEDDPYTIEADRAIELIREKRKADANKFIKVFEENPDIQVLNGRYGPYIKAGKKNVKIPKNKKPEDLTLEECLELAEKAPEKKRRRKAR